MSVTIVRVWDWILTLLDHLQIVTTNNYNTIANLHTLQITRAYAKPFPVSSVFTSSCLVNAANSQDSSASVLTAVLAGDWLITCPVGPWYIASTRTTQKTPFPTIPPLLRVSCCCGNLFICDCCQETALVYLLISRSFHSKGSTCYNILRAPSSSAPFV
jgi:hypothetical protein